jgi:Lrp/AsnC family transcriptional regulator for asnA, asnC and gidA
MSAGSDIDRKILEILDKDARASNREISRLLGVAEGTVRNRVKRLIADKVLKFGAIVTPAALDLNCTAFVRLAVSPSEVSSVSAHLVGLVNVAFVGLAVGLYDVVAVVSIKDRHALLRLIQTEIETLPGVTAVDVREHMSIYKHRYNEVRIT